MTVWNQRARDRDKRRKAYAMAIACLNAWDQVIQQCTAAGIEPPEFSLSAFRQSIDDIEKLDPGLSAILRESYAEYL